MRLLASWRGNLRHFDHFDLLVIFDEGFIYYSNGVLPLFWHLTLILSGQLASPLLILSIILFYCSRVFDLSRGSWRILLFIFP
jgi:hypothetical protein